MPWIIPENKLDVQQRDFLDNTDINKRNVWISGFAGSGKSVLLVYAIQKIKSESPDARVILIVFTRSLVEMFTAAFSEMKLHVGVITYYEFIDGTDSYDYIFCDEVQDLIPDVLQKMKDRGSHIIVAGDSNQSIYTCDPRWRKPTVNPSRIGYYIDGGKFELSIIHRLSRSIINALQLFLPNMNIFSAKKDMTKSDTQIRLCEAHSEKEEVKYIMEQAGKAVSQGYTSAVLIPSQKKIIEFANKALQAANKQEWKDSTNQYGRTDFGSLNSHLFKMGIKMQYVGNGYGRFSEDGKRIVLMTFHSAKGLDFDNVFIPFANSSMFINADETLAKTLFMVAMTRSRENLYITYHGYPSDYLDAFKSKCSQINISSTQTAVPTSSGSNLWGF